MTEGCDQQFGAEMGTGQYHANAFDVYESDY